MKLEREIPGKEIKPYKYMNLLRSQGLFRELQTMQNGWSTSELWQWMRSGSFQGS